MPKNMVQIFAVEPQNVLNPYKCIFFTNLEGLHLKMHSEGQYFRLDFEMDNFYIKDFYSPLPQMPYVLQTIFSSAQSAAKDSALTCTFEAHPKD